MLLSVELKAAVLMAVFMHRLELIQALRSADRRALQVMPRRV